MPYDYSLTKYPRTQHLEGSRLQEGDYDLSQVPFSNLLGKHVVVEEKVDGANSALSFDDQGNLLIQSRGRYLTGGFRERHYNLLKVWANANRDALWGALSDRYVMYGEWMFAKHKVFYDALPSYFLEFDVYDRATGTFLDTVRRKQIAQKAGVTSVPVLAEGVFTSPKQILSLLGHSNYITDSHLQTLANYCNSQGLDADKIIAETDNSTTMEGLYVKVEEDGIVTQRAKYVRGDFAQRVQQDTSNWQRKAIVPNQLKK